MTLAHKQDTGEIFIAQQNLIVHVCCLAKFFISELIFFLDIDLWRMRSIIEEI
jgi:hypothetical protein